MLKKGKINLNAFFAKAEENVPWKISDVLFTYFSVFALSLIAVGILILLNVDTETSLFPALLQIVISVATIAIIYAIVSKKYEIPFDKAFGINFKEMSGYFMQGTFVALLLLISTTIISLAFSQFIGVDKQDPYSGLPIEKLKVISLLAVFIAPIVEEIFFRGFMQPALIKNLGAFGGILVTALIFGISHTQYLDYSTAITAVTVIGLILGITRYKTGSVVPGIFAHLLNNLLAAISLYK